MKTKIILFFLIIPILYSNISCDKKNQMPIAADSLKDLRPLAPFEGRIIFQSNMDGDNEIYLLSNGELKKLTENTWEDEFPVWSPDGQRIAFTANPKGNYDIFIMNAEGKKIKAVTDSSLDEIEPAWFPDGLSMIFTQQKKGFLQKKLALYKINLKTKKIQKVIPDYSQTHGIANISPDASLITFTGKRTIGWDAAVYNLKTGTVRYLEDKGKSCRARFSNNGIFLAYVSGIIDGKGDIWMMNPDGSHKIRLTDRDETYDYFPDWSPDNQKIVFCTSDQHHLKGDWKLCLLEIQTREVTTLFDSPGNDIFPDWK